MAILSKGINRDVRVTTLPIEARFLLVIVLTKMTTDGLLVTPRGPIGFFLAQLTGLPLRSVQASMPLLFERGLVVRSTTGLLAPRCVVDALTVRDAT